MIIKLTNLRRHAPRIKPGLHKAADVTRNFVMHIKADHRKTNSVLYFGIVIILFALLVSNSDSYLTRIVWTPFLLLFGLSLVSAAMLFRYIIHIDGKNISISSRFGIRSKRISLDDIKRVKVLEKELPIGIYGSNLLSYLFTDRKFNRHKEIALFDAWGKRIFRIDGQSIANDDFARFVNYLKR